MKRTLMCGIAALAVAAVGLTLHAATDTPDPAAPPASAPAAPDAPLDKGATAPDFKLTDQNDTAHQLSALRGKVVVLAFYPADMTGGCTMEAHSLTQSLPDFQKRGVTVFGISVQDVASKKAFCARDGITYPLLADDQKTTARAYGVLQGAVASRVTFIIAPDGTIAETIRNVNVGTHGTDVLARLDALKLDTPVETPPAKVSIGKTVAPFTLPDTVSGKNVTVGDWQSAKATVVIFVSTRCPFSNSYNGRMAALATTYGPKGVRVYAVNSNKSEGVQEIAQHAKQHGFTFPVLKDAGSKIADVFTASVTPEAYVIGADGVLRYWGRVDDSKEESGVTQRDLNIALDSLLAGKPITHPKTSAFGCSIKRG